MSNVTLKDLSKALNISVSTVSKALRDSYEISTDTKRKVKSLAQELGYVPNPYAGFLRNQKSKTIAVVIPELTNNYFIQAISGAESVAQEFNYHVLIYTTNDDKEKEKSILSHLQNGRVDGILLSASGNTSQYSHIVDVIQSGIPVVFFDRVCHEIETAKVTTNDFTSGFIATEHLINSGCKNIAYLSISENLSIDNKRKQGYFEALHKYDIAIDKSRIIQCSNDESQSLQKIKKLLQDKNRPDGIFASVEKLALNTYHLCKHLNINIPTDLKIISFSNLRTADLLDPSLTTITQPAFEIGKEGARLLFKHLAKRNSMIENETVIIDSVLTIRNSTNNKMGVKK
jgi:LacI family transcriptional regulator